MAELATFNLANYYLFDRLEEGLGDKDAILFGDQKHTYAEVASSSRDLAAHLMGVGIAREQRVLIILPDSPAYAWAFFATLRIGAVVAMGNPISSAEDLAYLVQYTRATAVITTETVAQALSQSWSTNQSKSPDAAPHLVVAKDINTGDDVLGAPTRCPGGAISLPKAIEDGRKRRDKGCADARATARHDPAIWLFTSGSTGRSKAAMHCHSDFAFNTERYAIKTVGYRRGDITVSVPKLFFGYATGTNLMFPFRVGATTGLFTERPTPASLSEAIHRYRPTVVTNVPTMMGKLLSDDEERKQRSESPLDLSSVRFHLSAGEALPKALLDRFIGRFGGEVFDGIGSAEMFHIYVSNRPGDVLPGSLGRAVEGYEIRILPVEADGPGATPAAVDERGVMWVRGDSVATGYFQDREKSFATFFGHWCRTGDLFRVDADGYYYFEGRADDLMKVGGIWVAPVEVEQCLMRHKSVAAAAVIATKVDGLIKPKALIVCRPGESSSEQLAEELKAHVRGALSKHKYPRQVAFVDELPKNDRGKVDKKQLAAQQAEGTLPEGY